MSSLRTISTASPIRIRVLAMLLALTGLLFVTAGTSTASAAPRPALVVPVETVTTPSGDKVTGEYRITRFVAKKGELFAKGSFVGKVTSDGDVTKVRKAVTIPVDVTSAAAPGAAAAGDVAAQAVSCDILTLQLGPLDLNLLGLRIQLNQVNLDITAEQAPGNLLGNLLCAVANLLNGPPSLTTIIAQLLNAILGILG